MNNKMGFRTGGKVLRYCSLLKIKLERLEKEKFRLEMIDHLNQDQALELGRIKVEISEVKRILEKYEKGEE